MPLHQKDEQIKSRGRRVALFLQFFISFYVFCTVYIFKSPISYMKIRIGERRKSRSSLTCRVHVHLS